MTLKTNLFELPKSLMKKYKILTRTTNALSSELYKTTAAPQCFLNSANVVSSRHLK